MKTDDTCDIVFVNETKVRNAERKLEANNHLRQLSETFKLLGDPTRLKIILALKEEELCGCDLASLLGVSRSAISHQLRLLRSFRLVRFRREGKISYYSLDDTHISDIVEAAQEHMSE